MLKGGVRAWQEAGYGMLDPLDPEFYRWRGDTEPERKLTTPSDI